MLQQKVTFKVTRTAIYVVVSLLVYTSYSGYMDAELRARKSLLLARVGEWRSYNPPMVKGSSNEDVSRNNDVGSPKGALSSGDSENEGGQFRGHSPEGDSQIMTTTSQHGLAQAGILSRPTSSSSSSLVISNSSSAKPYFILHIGPPKSATTAIQCGLERISGELARRDNYYYLGSACRPGQSLKMENGVQSIKMFDFVLSVNEQRGTTAAAGGNGSKILDDVKALISYHRHEGHNLVMSSEHFTSRMKQTKDAWKNLSDLLDGFQVKIVVGYRHYAQWLPSMYYQRNQGERYLKWPHEGGKDHPSFREYLEDRLNQWEESGQDNLRDRDMTHHSLWALLAWSRYFPQDDRTVEIFDLQQTGDTLTNFVCTMLPTAGNTCQLLRDYVEAKGRTVVKRVSSNFHAERVVEAAYRNGMLQDGTIKALPVHVAKYMMSRSKVHEDPALWTCLSEPLEGRFRNVSRTFMELVYTASGKNLTDEGWYRVRQDHDASFEATKALGRFCDINPTAVLQNTTLVEYIFGRFYNGTGDREGY